MKKIKEMLYNTDSIELVLFIALAFCFGWGAYQVVIGLIGRFM